MVTSRFPVALALMLAAASFPMTPEAEAQSSGKNSSKLEEHYETLPPDVEPGSEVQDPAGDSSLPEADPEPAPRTSSHKTGTNSGDGNRDGRDDGAVNGRDGEERARMRDASRRRPGDTVPDDGDDIADVSYFYDTLDSGGEWITHPRFGEVWRPNVDHDWRPYTLGRWAYSDDFGWTWISDEPFGWAVYHYGRWSFGRDDGWVWIPGTEWGPAWVAWRHGEEAIGWAPLPPNARFEQGRMAFDASELESERYEPMWVFVRPRYFARPEMRRYLRPASWNAELRYRTTPNVGPNSGPGAGFERFAREKRRYYSNRGLRLEDVERLAKRPVTRVRVAPVDEPSLRKRDRFDDWRERGNREVKIYRPERRRTQEALRKRPRDKAGMPPNATKESARGASPADPATTTPRRAGTPPAATEVAKDAAAAPTASQGSSVPNSSPPKTSSPAAHAGRDATPDASPDASNPAAKSTGVRQGVFAAPTTGSIPQSAATGSTTASQSTGTASATPTDPGPETVPARPSASKKRWDGSGPSGAPSPSETPAQ